MSRLICRVFAANSLAMLGAAGGPASVPPTYHRDVEPILQKHCQDCHRPGQVAPFSLLDFRQASKRAADIASVTSDRVMPPWHASTTQGGPFRDPRVLNEDEIRTLARWSEAGAPEGDPGEAPTPRSFSSAWPLGEPDLVLTPAEPYTIGPEGEDEFRVFVVPSGLTEGRWISAIDYRPGNAKVVHHVLGAFDTTGRARVLDQAEPGVGYKTFSGFGNLPGGLPFVPAGGLSGWAPGKSPRPLPVGVGRFLPAGSDVLLQVHYHRTGKPERDATSVALYFSKTPVEKVVRTPMILPPTGLLGLPKLAIPVGDADHEVRGTFTVAYDAHAIAVVPHMHWLGKDFRLEATRPDGTKQTLIRIDRWDFNWQDTYDFADQPRLPKGTVVEMVAHFDNSASNPSNPSKPPIAVRWGEQTQNEMCIAFLQLTRDDERLENLPPIKFRSPASPRSETAAAPAKGD